MVEEVNYFLIFNIVFNNFSGRSGSSSFGGFPFGGGFPSGGQQRRSQQGKRGGAQNFSFKFN